MISCASCNRSFANKNSLRTHRSTFHQKQLEPREDIHQEDADSTMEEHDSEFSEDRRNKTASLDSGAESETSTSTDEESTKKDTLASETDDQDSASSYKNCMTNESDNQASTSPQDDTNETENSDTTDTVVRKRKSTHQNKVFKKRVRKANRWSKDRVFDLLSSIDSMLDKHTSKSSTPFDLLGSYSLKTELFGNLHDFFGTQVLLEKALTHEEKLLLDAVLATTDLDLVTRLLNKNVRLVVGIIEKTKTNEKGILD